MHAIRNNRSDSALTLINTEIFQDENIDCILCSCECLKASRTTCQRVKLLTCQLADTKVNSLMSQFINWSSHWLWSELTNNDGQLANEWHTLTQLTIWRICCRWLYFQWLDQLSSWLFMSESWPISDSVCWQPATVWRPQSSTWDYCAVELCTFGLTEAWSCLLFAYRRCRNESRCTCWWSNF